MEPNVLCQYCDRNCYLQFESDIFSKWLLDVLGPVLMGVKPAEVMSFALADPVSLQKLRCIERLFKSCCRISMYRMKTDGTSVKYLFYHRKALEETLQDHRVRRFLHRYGYPREFTLESWLAHLHSRFRLVGMPHEIGVFLGYPLKDVMGFTGAARLKHTKTQGWWVYGDPRLSDQAYSRHQAARAEMRVRLKRESVESILG